MLGLLFTIAGFIFILLMLLVYVSKSRTIKNNLSIKLFRLTIDFVIYLSITEFIVVFVNSITEIYWIRLLFLKIHWVSGLICLYFVILYLYSESFNYRNYTFKLFLKNDKIVRYFSIASLVYFVIFLVFPVTIENIVDNYTPLPILLLFVPYYGSGYIVMFKYIILNKKVSKHIKNTIYTFTGVFLAIIVFQFIYTNISFWIIGVTFMVYVLYFFIANPDLILIEEIDNLKASIDKSNRAKSDFLSNMSHEIRSPMNAILGFSETILNDEEYDQQRTINDLNYINSSSKTLLEITKNILDISKIETGSDTIENKEYSLKEHILDWNGIVNTRLANKNIKYILNVDKEIPSKLYGDSTKVFQIVLNLLTNAIKYTEVGRITLNIEKTINNNKEVTLKFTVADTGFGIKEEDKPKVFEKFTRLDEATTNEIEGTGLGLVLTKRYAELMGGKLWFESEYRVGSKFYFEIPQRIVDNTPIGDINQTIEINESKKLKDFSNYRVIVVDDDMLSLKVTRRILEAYNLDIVTVSDAKECINAIKMDEHFDLILLDHIMNKMDGIEAFNIIKNLKVFCDIPPIIMLTANAIAGVKEMYLKEGFDGYLSKPIDINELDRLLNTYLK
jgi:signal transduction histidine kinase/ActR/RegA family two-component response regulator